MSNAKIDPQDLDLARQIVRRKVSQLTRRRLCREQDAEDTSQELLLRLLPRLANFDASRCPLEAFLRLVVHRLAANMVRDWIIQRHNTPGVISLEQLVGRMGNAAELDERDRHRHRHAAPRLQREIADLAIDVAGLLASLPQPLRRLAKRVMHDRVSEVARRTGLPESTLCDLLRRLRTLFRRAGW